jgi:putative PIN family toxin of toxin-antitoxin system
MRIVIDTNVLARATPGRKGPAESVLMMALSPPHLLLASDFVLDELARVLRYNRMRRLHGLPDDRIDAFVDFVRTGSVVVPVPSSGAGAFVPSDPDDDPIVATAILGQANVLCTRDRHLRQPTVTTYCQQFGIRVLTDLELLPILRQGIQP